MPSTLSTVNAVFRGKYRAAAFGVWGAVISGAAAIGPLAGGMLTQWASWHWIFIVNIPLIAGLLVAAWLLVPETKGVKTRRGVDVDGGLLAAIGFGSLAFAVVEGPHRGWITASDGSGTLSIIPIVFGVALIALTLFVLWERHRDKVERDALLDLGLFRFRTFSWGNITAAMVAIGEFAIIFVLPLYLVNVLGLSVLTTGLVLSGMAIGAFCSGAAARHLAARLGAVGTALLGLVIELVGVVALVVTVTPTTPAAVITLPLVLYGLGLGLASAQLTGTVLQDVPAEVSGQASATQSTVRQIGAALGTALAGASLSTALHITLPPALAAAGVTGSAASELARATRDSAGTNLPQVNDAAIHSVLTDGFSAATQWSLLFAGVFLLVGVIGAWQLKRATAVSQRDTIRS